MQPMCPPPLHPSPHLPCQVNKLSSRTEDLFDENSKLRKLAGVGDGDKVDIKDVRLQKEAQITQLRSLNALLERQVGEGRALASGHCALDGLRSADVPS